MCPERQRVPVSWQYIQMFLRHFTQNHTCVSLVVEWSKRSIYTVYIILKLYKKDTVWPNLSIRDKVLCNFVPLHQDQQLLQMLWSILLIMSRSVERTFGCLLSKISCSASSGTSLRLWFDLFYANLTGKCEGKHGIGRSWPQVTILQKSSVSGEKKGVKTVNYWSLCQSSTTITHSSAIIRCGGLELISDFSDKQPCTVQ